jgi:peptide/nickel transport system substrate-binding protein
MIPVLAEGWERMFAGRRWIMNLRRNVWFHNGRELTAEIVKWNFDRILDPRSGALLGPIFRGMGLTTRVVDKYTIQFDLTNGFGTFLSHLTNNARACILAPESARSDGTIEKPVSTGPFVFESWRPGAEIRFRRFDRYWQRGEDGRPLPYVDALVIKIVPDANVRLTALRAREVDLITHPSLDEVKRWTTGGPPAGLSFHKYFYNYSDYVGLNVRRTVFSDLRVRQAIKLAVDREAINEAVHAGLAELHNQPFKRTSLWYVDVPYPRPDLARARELLRQAGLQAGTEVTYSVWAPQYERYADIIQGQLAQIGLRVRLLKRDFASFWRLGPTYEADMQLMPIGTIFHPDRPYAYLEADNPLHWLTGGFSLPEYDALLVRARNEADIDKAKTIYKTLVQRVEEHATPIYLMNPPLVHVFRDYVTGYAPIDQGVMALAATVGVHKAWLAK